MEDGTELRSDTSSQEGSRPLPADVCAGRRAHLELRPFPGLPGFYFRWPFGIFPGLACKVSVAVSVWTAGVLSRLPHACTRPPSPGIGSCSHSHDRRPLQPSALSAQLPCRWPLLSMVLLGLRIAGALCGVSRLTAETKPLVLTARSSGPEPRGQPGWWEG